MREILDEWGYCTGERVHVIYDGGMKTARPERRRSCFATVRASLGYGRAAGQSRKKVRIKN